MTPGPPIPPPDNLQPPAACPVCGNPDRLFAPDAVRRPSRLPSTGEPAWQCTQCGELEFVVSPDSDPAPMADFLRPVPVDAKGRLWLAPDCGDWGTIVRRHHLTAVFDLEDTLDHGIPAHPDHLVYVYFPFMDDDLPTLHKLHALARLGAQLMHEGERVLVHCEMGLNRSALLAGLMLVHSGMSGAEAVAVLQHRRPGALFNERFAEYLRSQPAGGLR